MMVTPTMTRRELFKTWIKNYWRMVLAGGLVGAFWACIGILLLPFIMIGFGLAVGAVLACVAYTASVNLINFTALWVR